MRQTKLDPERAALVVIDVQEAFRKAVPSFGEVAAAAATLVQGAARIGKRQMNRPINETRPSTSAVVAEGCGCGA